MDLGRQLNIFVKAEVHVISGYALSAGADKHNKNIELHDNASLHFYPISSGICRK